SYHIHPQLRELPSFPTRRSSDLGRSRVRAVLLPDDRDRLARRRAECFRAAKSPSAAEGRAKRERPSKCEWRARAAGVEAFVLGRSEGHTSELQSQSNLVCRLLLE